MKYISTRGQAAAVCAADAIIKGIAEDGGLYVPESIPAWFPQDIAAMSYAEMAKKIFALYLTDFAQEEIDHIVDEAYAAKNFPDGPVGVTFLDDTEVLELWHGPTSAFKDMALQVLPYLLVASLRKSGGDKEIVILVATSGDTGKAALEGFSDVPHTRIIVFYPKDGVSPIQELQMNTTAGANTRVIGVKGNFDDCQNGVKDIFGDRRLAADMAAKGLYFSSANSINWGRLLPQIVYYFYGYAAMVKEGRIRQGEPIDISVPTGNFGDILAGWYAMRMGLPVRRFICASNKNKVLTDALEDGYYDRERPFYKTSSPSMDILISSNFERYIFDISGNDSKLTAELFRQLKEDGHFTIPDGLRNSDAAPMRGGYAEEEQCLAAIRDVFAAYHYVLDPHSAVGYEVASRLRRDEQGRPPLLLVSTASPYKFPEAVLGALGELPQDADEMALPGILARVSGTAVPPNLAELADLPVKHDTVCAKEEMEAVIRRDMGL